jgi:hypothetical protein
MGWTRLPINNAKQFDQSQYCNCSSCSTALLSLSAHFLSSCKLPRKLLVMFHWKFPAQLVSVDFTQSMQRSVCISQRALHVRCCRPIWFGGVWTESKHQYVHQTSVYVWRSPLMSTSNQHQLMHQQLLVIQQRPHCLLSLQHQQQPPPPQPPQQLL